jgi:hypothetical protein
MKARSLQGMMLILIAGICAFLPSPGFSADGTPMAFLQSVYATYQKSGKANDIDSDAKAARYFTPAVVRLLANDRAEMEKSGDIGRIDFDPFVGGQDWAKTKIMLKVDPGSAPDQASGTATFIPVGAKKATTVRLDLAKTAAGWRIADIHWEGEEKSLVELLSAKE